MSPLTVLLVVLTEELDKVPAPEDVKAGWGAFALFLTLGAAVVLLGISLSRHLRKARDNAERGVFGPVGDGTDAGTEDRPAPGAGQASGSSDRGAS